METRKIIISCVAFSRNWAGGVEFLPDEAEYPVSFWEGPRGPKGAGGRISLKDAIEPMGVRKLTEFGAVWFLPVLQRLARGENVGVEEILSYGKEVTGHIPDIILVDE